MPIYSKMIPFSNIKHHYPLHKLLKHFQATYEREVLTKMDRGTMTQTVKKEMEKATSH